MRMHSIFLLLLTSISLLYAEAEMHFSFEVLQGEPGYRNILQKRAKSLNNDGFDCHIVEGSDSLSLRCNDVYDIDKLTSEIQKFKTNHVNYVLLDIGENNTTRIKGKVFPFYLGYTVYNRGEYAKAAKIFRLNYAEEKSIEYAYAYALALFRLSDYRKSLEVLLPHTDDPKASELFQDILQTYLDQLILKHHYADAHRLIADMKLSPDENEKLLQKIDYSHALILSQKKDYEEANQLLLPYERKYPKSKELLVGNVMALSANDLESKQYLNALDRLKVYEDDSQKVAEFSHEIQFYYYQDEGWKALEDNPKKALEYFIKNCEANTTDECLEGQMYSYSKMGETKYTILLAKQLYAKHQDDKYLKVLTQDYLQEKNVKQAQYYYKLIKDKRGIKAPPYLPYAQKKVALLEKDHEKEQLLRYNKAKEYKRCHTYAEKLLKIRSDKDIARIGGWCAYNDAQYQKAKDFFEFTVTKKSEDEDLCALALSAYKSHNIARSREALALIKNPYRKPEEIILLYVDIDQSRSAKELLVEMDDSPKRDVLLRRVNKSLKRESPITQVVGGLSYYKNKGIRGEKYLEVRATPLDIDYLSEDGDYHWYGDIDFLHISDGARRSMDGVEGVFGLWTNTFNAEIGFTPSSAEIPPAVTGRLYAHHTWDQWDVHAAVEQYGIKQSYLSYVGQKVFYNGEEYQWGRVLKQGVTVGLSYDSDVTYTLDLFYYPKIFAENVIENSESKVSASAVYHTPTEKFAFLDWGAVAVYDSFETNSDLFTYGYGGYFSPQNFWLVSAVLDVGDYIGEDTYYRFEGALGYETYSVDAIGELNAPLSSFREAYDERGVTAKASLQIGHYVNEHIDLSAGISWEKMYGYDLLRAGVSISYHFDTQKRASLKRLRDAHKVNELIP